MILQRQRFFVVAIALAAATLPAFPLQASIGQRISNVALEETTTQLALSWSQILDRMRRQEVPGGSRGNRNQPTVCAVVPGALIDEATEEASSLKMWGLNPVFVWQSEWTHLEVFRSRDHEILMRQQLAPGSRHLVYGNVEDAIPLEPGGSYYWKLSRDGSDGQVPTFGETSFRTLDQEERRKLSADLDYELSGFDDSEAALSKRVNFFAEHGLWADVFRELYVAEQLPAELEQLKDEIAGHDFCDQSRTINLTYL